jgi:putative PIN family toxin of toxin-antitoxin system
MRIVVDTNVLVSAFLNKPSSPRKVINLQQAGRYHLVLSVAILTEYRRVLSQPDLLKRHRLSQERVLRYLTLLERASLVVTPAQAGKVIQDDPDDDKFLFCAVAGNAEYIVSGDRHLLDLREYQGIRILPPTAFLALLRIGFCDWCSRHVQTRAAQIWETAD